jgi:hypothetical protein
LRFRTGWNEVLKFFLKRRIDKKRFYKRVPSNINQHHQHHNRNNNDNRHNYKQLKINSYYFESFIPLELAVFEGKYFLIRIKVALEFTEAS